MDLLLSRTFGGLTVGTPLQHANLAAYPLLRTAADPAPGYATLDDAMAAGRCRMSEISESGSVPELRFENLSPVPVLMLDGEELVGAKQNRVLNLTILVGGELKLNIPVSCVEHGRWRYRSTQFAAGGRKLFSKARAAKLRSVSESLESGRGRRSDQGRVWDDIAAKSARMQASSDTGASEAIYDLHRPTVAQFVDALPVQPCQVGCVFAIDGVVAGLELFDAHSTCAKVMRKLVESYALDALDVDAPSQRLAPPELVQAFVEQVVRAPVQSFKAIGVGHDLRLRSERVIGAALAADERIVHLSAFNVRHADA